MSDPDVPRVDAVLVRGRANRSSQAALGVGVLLAAFVGLAVLKPWGGTVRTVDASPRPASPAMSAPPPGAITAPDPTPKLAVVRPTPDAVRLALQPRDEWGVRVIVPSTGAAGFESDVLVERWTPLPSGPIPPDRQPWRPGGTGALELSTGFRPVVALGLTGPDLDVPLDTRVWRLLPGAVPQLMVPQAVAADPGRPLWFPRDLAGSSLPEWPPGTYRIDLLAGDGISRIVVRVPGPEPEPEPSSLGAGTMRPVDPATRLALGTVRPEDDTGMAVIVDDLAIPLPGVAGRRPDELTSWTDPFPRDPQTPASSRVLAHAPTALAWYLEPRARPVSAEVTMLAPIERRFALEDERVVVARQDGRRDAIVLREASGHPWLPGIYRIDATWVGLDGDRHQSSWHLDLAPVGDREPPGALVGRVRAAGVFEPRKAADGTRAPILGDGDRFHGGAIARPREACADRSPFQPDLAALGMGPIASRPVEELHVARLFEDAIRVPVRAGLVRPGHDRLAFVIPGPGHWDPGAYRISVRYEAADALGLRSDTFLLCVGVRNGDALRFDPDTTLFVRP